MNIYVINHTDTNMAIIVVAQSMGGAWRLALEAGFTNDMNHTIGNIAKLPYAKLESILWTNKK